MSNLGAATGNYSSDVKRMDGRQEAEHAEICAFHSDRTEVLRAAILPFDAVSTAVEGAALVPGLMDHGTFSVLFGPSNVGKTFVALDIAFRVAAGADWNGVQTGSRQGGPGRVLYIACEGGRGIRNRIAALKKAFPDLAAAVSKHASFYLLPTSIDLLCSSEASDLIEALPTKEVDLIIVDTLSRAFGSGDENTSRDMGAFIASIDALRAVTGAHVMAVHHSGKVRAAGPRGASRLFCDADTVLKISKRQNGLGKLSTEKQRDGERDQTWSYQIQPVDLESDQIGSPVASAVIQWKDLHTEDSETKRVLRSDVQRRALELLDKLVAEGDQPDGAASGVPLSEWRKCCQAEGLSKAQRKNTQNKNFHDAKCGLEEKGYISIENDVVYRRKL